MSTLGERLRSVRGGRSCNKFAELYGVHANSLRRYEKGIRAKVPHDFLERVISGEKLNPNWLFSGDGSMYATEENVLADNASNTERENPQETMVTILREQIAVLKQNVELAKLAVDALRQENDTLREQNETLKKQVAILEEMLEAERRRAAKTDVNGMSAAG